MNARFRIYRPFPAYVEYLKRNNIPFETKQTNDKCQYIEFEAKDRFSATEQYIGLCGISGYIYETKNGKETVLQPL